VVVKLSDRAALFELAHDNAQRIWHPLDVGQHIIDTGLSIRKYMRKFGLKLGAVQQRLYSARVYSAVRDDVNEDLRPFWRQMAVIYSAPRTEWVGLVERVIDNGVNADGVRRILKERRSRETTPPASEEEDDGDMEGIEAAKVVPAVHVGDRDDDRRGVAKYAADARGHEDYCSKFTKVPANLPTLMMTVFENCVEHANIEALDGRQRIELIRYLVMTYNIKIGLHQMI
jgi:hypothetical protein